MILRRIAQHVKEQNWTTIGIDLVIVVVGVFLGIQLGNWNADRADRAAYDRALDRLDAEIETNLGILDDIDPDLAASQQIVRRGFDALRSCVASDANRRAVEAGLEQIRGTYGLHLRRIALDELTTDPRLLAQQSETERQRLADMLFAFDLMQGEAHFAEYHPLEGRIETNPVIGIGAARDTSYTYFGADYSNTRYPLVLAVPVDQACRDDALVKTFFTWSRWQGVLPVATRSIRHELTETRTLLAERRP